MHLTPTYTPAALVCEASEVRIGYVWLMVLAGAAGLVVALLNLVTAPSAGVLLLAGALLALGYLAWRRSYQAVRLELRPDSLHIQYAAPGRPAEDLALSRIANYLRPSETYYQVLELQLHGGSKRHFGKRLRAAVSLLTLDEWAEQLAAQLEQTRPVAMAGSRAGTAAGSGPAAPSGLSATAPRVFARTMFGKILAGVALVWLLLAALTLLGPNHVPSAVFVVPALYLGYYSRARGALKVETRVLTGIEVERDDRRYGD